MRICHAQTNQRIFARARIYIYIYIYIYMCVCVCVCLKVSRVYVEKSAKELRVVIKKALLLAKRYQCS